MGHDAVVLLAGLREGKTIWDKGGGHTFMRYI